MFILQSMYVLCCSIAETPLENVAFGIPIAVFGEPSSPDTLSFDLSYRGESAGNVTGIFLHWSTLGGPTIRSITLDPDTSSYTIEGLSPDTSYNITAFLVNICGKGQGNSISLMTGPANGNVSPTATTAITTITTMRMNVNPTSTVRATPGELVHFLKFCACHSLFG